MSDYIKRSDVLNVLRAYSLENPSSLGHHSGAVDVAMCAVDKLPAADVVPVVHGEWIDKYNDCSCAECTICGDFYETTDQDCVTAYSFKLFRRFYKFCPNCGAKMDGGESGR